METVEYLPEGPWIRTRYGRFHADAPEFNHNDIAHALGMIVRFNGHVLKFYSVAEHSLLVRGLMLNVTGGIPFEGLMHDATEAYLSDVPKPFKQKLVDLDRWDRSLETALRHQYGLPESTTAECKRADWLALAIEAHFLIDGGGVDFYYPPGVYSEAMSLVKDKWRVQCLEPAVASKIWLDAFEHDSKEESKVISIG